MAGIGGAVVVAVGDALGLVILEEGPVLIAADEAVALFLGDGDNAGRVAVFVDVALIDGAPYEAAGVRACGDIAQSEAIADDAAVAKPHKAGCVGALGGDVHGGPAALDKPLFLVSTHEARVANGGGGVGGEGAALHVAFANDAVVPADHAAQHRAGVGGDIGVHHGAFFKAAVVVVDQNGGIVGEEDVGAVDGQVMDISGGAGVPEKTGVAVAEGEAGDLVPLSVKFAHEGIGDGADGLGLCLVSGRESGEVDVSGESVIFAPRHRLLAGGGGSVGGLVLHVGKGNPLLGGGNVHPFFFGGFFRAGGGMIHLAVCGGNAVGEPQFPVYGAVCNGGDGESILLFRSDCVGEICGGILPRHGEGTEEGIGAVFSATGYQIEVNLVNAGEVFPAVPLCSGAVPLHTRDHFHTVVGALNAHYLIVYLRGKDIGGFSVCLHSHGGIVDALGQCGKGGSKVIPGLGNTGNVLRKGQLRYVGTQIIIIISDQADDECCAVFHGSVPREHLLWVAFRLVNSCVQCGKPCFLLGSHAADDRSFVYILQLFKVGEVGGLAADFAIFCLFFCCEGNPAFLGSPQRNGVALRTVLRGPLEKAGGEGAFLPVLRGDGDAGEGSGDELHALGRGGDLLPLENGQIAVHAADALPVFAQLAQQVGLHGGEGHAFGGADFCTLRNASGEVIAVGEGIIRAGGKCTGGGSVLAGNSAGSVSIGNGGAAAGVNASRIGFGMNISGIVAVAQRDGTAASVETGDDTGGAVFGGHTAGVIAAGNCQRTTGGLAVAQNAAHIAATGNVGLVAAVGDGVGCTNGTTDNAACIAAAAGNRALNDDILDLGILNHTEETGILGANVQTGDGVALSVKAALIGVYAGVTGLCANGRKGIAAQINIVGQFRIEFRNTGSIIDGIGQPCQLSTIFNLIGRFHRTLTGGILFFGSVPCGGGSQGNGNGLILGNGEGFAHLGIALCLDGVGVFAVGQLVGAAGLCVNSLAVPSHCDGGISVCRGDIEGDRALFYGREGNVLIDRAAADGDFAILCPIAEGGDSVVIFAVGESERPVAAGIRTGLPINGDHGVLRGDGEGDSVGGNLPTEDGVAVIDARRIFDECTVRRECQRFQIVGGFGCGVVVGAEGVEVVAVSDAAAALFADYGVAVAAGNRSGGVAVFDSGIAAVKICSDTTGAPATAGDCSAVVAVLNGNCAGNIGSDAGSIVACGRN